MKYLLIALLLFSITTFGKTNTCKFEITFKLDSVDEIKRCSFGFLILDDQKFKGLSYSVQNNIVKIVGSMLYKDNWSDKDFPILWIQKKIKGKESIRAVNNCYIEFENLKFKKEIKINIDTICKIEETIIAKVDNNGGIKCLDEIPLDFPTWKFNINTEIIPNKKPNR